MGRWRKRRRSSLAEYLVANALEAATRPRVEWDAYDVVTSDGLTVEVKSGAYLQAWEQKRHSKITFGGLCSSTLSASGAYAAEKTYNADVYVFAVLTATDHAAYDALDTSAWYFWVAPHDVIAGTGQRSIGLSRVQQLAEGPLPYGKLAAAIRRHPRAARSPLP